MDCADKKEIAEFWDTNPCGGEWNSLEGHMRWRYSKEPWIIDIINKLSLEDKTVLEIGCGPGLDTIKLSEAAKKVTGIDLSNRSLQKAMANIKARKITNASFALGDAENLAFKDNSVDVVFSYGVLHHTQTITKAIDEIQRVLKKGGYGSIMLYRSHTIQSAIISTVRFMKSALDKFKGFELYIKRREKINNPNKGTSILELLFCPVLNRYSRKEAVLLLDNFVDVKIECYQTGFSRLLDFMPISSGPLYNMVSRFLWGIEKLTCRRLGFYMVIYFKKSDAVSFS